MQLVLETEFFETGSRRCIKLCVFGPVGKIDLIHVIHQIQSGLPSHMLVECTAEIIGNIIFTVRESSGPRRIRS